VVRARGLDVDDRDPAEAPGDVATSAGSGIAAIISSKITRCSATSPPRSSGASRSSWSRASRCCRLTIVSSGFRGSELRLAEQQLGPVLRGECDRLGDKRAGGGIVERRRSLGSMRDRNAELLEELLLALREVSNACDPSRKPEPT